MRWTKRSIVACLLVLASVGLVPLGEPRTALADDATINVCTERAFSDALTAVQNSGGGRLVIACSDPIIFTSQKTITSDVTIVGDGAIFDGGNKTGLFQVEDGARLELAGLVLRNGKASEYGGAIYNTGTLVITASTFTGNRAETSGGAIFNILEAKTTVIASTFSNNSADFSAGAIYNVSSTLEVTGSTFSNNSADYGGAVSNFSDSTAVITSSTFSGNSVEVWGGAIRNVLATMTIAASTFGGNSAAAGAAIDSGGGWADLTLRSSVLNRGPSGNNCSISRTFRSEGYNLSDDASCGLAATGDQQGVTVTLGALQDNGGPTETMLPESDNAVDIIPQTDCASLSSPTGQRGVSRPRGNCEIGAVELGQVPVQILATYNTGPVLDGETATIGIIAFGPAGAALTYYFNCDDQGPADVTQIDDPSASCPFSVPGSYPVPVQVCDDAESCDTDVTTVEVLATVPTVESLSIQPSPSNEAEPVQLSAGFSHPDPSETFSCTIDWGDGTTTDGVVEDQDGGGSCRGSHSYLDDQPGGYTVTVQVCDGDEECDKSSTTQTVDNLPPTITEITPSDVGMPGDPVTVGVTASDPAGEHDSLRYAFDCEADGDYDIGLQPESSATCPTDPDRLSIAIGVRVSDDDGGIAEQTVALSLESPRYCANIYSGQLRLGTSGCRSGETAIALSTETTIFCASPWTGELAVMSVGCPAGWTTYQVPGPEPIPACVNVYSGALRVVSDEGSCGVYGSSHIIPAE